MNNLSVFGKYLDQPRLIGHFAKAVPAILIAGGSAYTIYHVEKTPKKEKRKEFIKTIAVLTGTITCALLAPKIALKIMKNTHVHAHAHGHCHYHEHEHGAKIDFGELKEKNTKLINNFLKNNDISIEISDILNKAKEKVLKFSEIKTLFEKIWETKQGQGFLNKLIPNPENIDSKHIFSEIGRISILGLMPVLGGIAGGIIGDKLTDRDWKEKIPDKIKEGSYQYLANIFSCNIGAGVALLALEKAQITSKAARATGMIGGILLMGLVLGSTVANWVGKTFIDSFFNKKNNSERTPEVLDVSLHVDDVATVAVMSGLKWIEPALPILYSISGYRAGIGYRNG